MNRTVRNIFFKKDLLIIVLSLLAAWAVYLCFLPSTLNPNNFIYAIGQIHTYDKSLFLSNVFMSEHGVSPRFAVDAIFALFMEINGGEWVSVAVPFVYISGFVLAVATVILAFRISKNNGILFAVVFALFFSQNVSQQIAVFDTFPETTIGMGMGYSLAILAVAFAVGGKKNFNAAWIALTLASIFHIHEGIYGSVVVLLFLLVEMICDRKMLIKENWCMVLCFMAMLAVTLPNMFTDQLNISAEEFVYIYGRYRHPHHLIPSTWGLSSIIKSLLLILFPVCYRMEYLLFYEKENVKKFIVETVLFLLAWFGALGIMYIGVEKMNIVALTTMFVSKFFKYVAIVSLLWYVKTVQGYFFHKEYTYGFIILVFAGTARFLESYMAIAFAVIFIYIYYHQKIVSERKTETYLYAGMQVCLFALIEIFMPAFKTSLKLKILLGIITIMVLTFYMWEKMRKRIFKLVCIMMAFVLLLSSSYGDFYRYHKGRLVAVTPEDVLINTCGQDIYQLAHNFKNQTDSDEGFLADPSDESGTGWMQIISERNCYVVYKVIPSSKAMMKEWYERYQQVSGLFEKSTEQIISIMKNTDISYLLVHMNHYEQIEGSGWFEVFTTCDGDSYRIYRLMA